MRIRRLQILDEDDKQWRDEAYVIEDNTGQIEFRYNTLTWGRVGASLNQRIQEEKISLEEIESLMPPNKEARWQDIEEIDNQTRDEVIAILDQDCQLPKPRPVVITKVVAT